MKKLLLLIFLLIPFFGLANVQLSNIFSDGMVLQRNQEKPVWGWADSGERIEVKPKNQVVETTAGQDGKWKLLLKPETHGGPLQLEVIISSL